MSCLLSHSDSYSRCTLSIERSTCSDFFLKGSRTPRPLLTLGHVFPSSTVIDLTGVCNCRSVEIYPKVWPHFYKGRPTFRVLETAYSSDLPFLRSVRNRFVDKTKFPRGMTCRPQITVRKKKSHKRKQDKRTPGSESQEFLSFTSSVNTPYDGKRKLHYRKSR